MSSIYPPISFCCGVYNEEEILLNKLQEIKTALTEIMGEQNFEIIITDNGSTDRTTEILRNLKDPVIRPFFADQKGHGLAHKTNILNAKNEHIVLTGIDVPFGFDDLRQVLPIWDKYDIILGSKAHKNSRIDYPWQRKITSKVYRFFLRIFFKLKIKDPQGSVFLKKSKVMEIIKYCDEINTFFTTQIIIYATLYNFKMTEVPVTLFAHKNKRKSKINIIRDGRQIFTSLLFEYSKYSKVKEELNQKSST